jgi:hypothetical protein
MRQRLGIIIAIILAIGLLVAINSLAFVSNDEKQDSEASPNRSTYNARPTGTRALHDFLNESGFKVMRWREPFEKLLAAEGAKVRTFVIVGQPRISIEEEEAESLLLWVGRGNRLVLVDRRPEEFLLPRSGNWRITTEWINFPLNVDPTQTSQMTEGVKALRPAQPTLLTQDVESVMPSRFYSSIKIFAESKKQEKKKDDDLLGFDDDEPPPAQKVSGDWSPAPVVHLNTPAAPILVDYPHGNGRITLLSDPFIVANNGVALNDNLQLAINILSPAEGLVAFDEYHQGHGTTHNAFVSYFEGTPVLAICGQIAFVILLILWTRGRRFGRALPLAQVDRRSSLEFVASMAELQQRARAYDLALENIYSRTRRVLTRYAGVDYNSSRKVIAERIAARSSIDARKIETLMKQAEDAINGGEISERQSLLLVKRMREIEGALGLRMRRRELKQQAENI